MRIVHVDTGPEMRGGQWQVVYLMEGLIQRGHQVRLLARRDGALQQQAAARGLPVEPVGLAALRKHRSWAEVVHTHCGRGHALAALAGARPLVVSRRVAFPVRRGPASRWKYGQAAMFVAVSEFVKCRLMEARIPSDRIRVVYDGVPQLDPARGGTRVLAPATGDPRKGSALVREATRLAGVEIHFSHDMQRDLAEAAMLIYISHEEGLGSGVLLAMAAGVPVVASRVGGLPEIVEDGVTGLLVANDAETIAAAIRRLLSDRALAEAMGARARERVASRFSLDHMIDSTLRVYEEAVS